MSKSAKDMEREQRLAEALRANLRRRKDQQRGQAAPKESMAGDGDSPSPPPAGTD